LPGSIPPIENTQYSAQERPDVAGLDRKDVSAKPCEQDHPIERNPSPLPPKAVTKASGPIRRLPREASQACAVDGEIITDVISFQEFWLAAGRRGHEGFARGEWRKLSVTDKAAISDRLQRDGELGLGNLWVGTWLRDRVWEEPAPAPIEPETDFVRPMFQHVEPGSELWRAERERWRAAGYCSIVKLMDDFAAAGRGWTVQRDVDR
jgi:hypothetical protein